VAAAERLDHPLRAEPLMNTVRNTTSNSIDLLLEGGRRAPRGASRSFLGAAGGVDVRAAASSISSVCAPSDDRDVVEGSVPFT
jgi:hypothetical protein